MMMTPHETNLAAVAMIWNRAANLDRLKKFIHVTSPKHLVLSRAGEKTNRAD